MKKQIESFEDKWARIQEAQWYHTIDLGKGMVTPGTFDLRDKVEHYGIPDDLKGKKVLDVGCSSGFWSFEFEKRGANVTAVDIPGERQDIADIVRLEEGEVHFSSGISKSGNPDEDFESSFILARDLLKSNVAFREVSIYDLAKAIPSQYDLVFCGSVLMHLTDPYKAIKNLRAVARNLVIISCTYFETELSMPAAFFRLNPRSIWTPNVACLCAMLEDAGFGRAFVHGYQTLTHNKKNIKIPHVIIHAYVS